MRTGSRYRRTRAWRPHTKDKEWAKAQDAAKLLAEFDAAAPQIVGAVKAGSIARDAAITARYVD